MIGWPQNRNHEAARRHVNQILRDHGRPDYSRRETQIAELLDELIRERDAGRDPRPPQNVEWDGRYDTGGL